MFRFFYDQEEPVPLAAPGGLLIVAVLLGGVVLEVLLAQAWFGIDREAGMLWAGRLGDFNRKAGLLWIAVGLWCMLSGLDLGRYVFAGGVMALTSRYLFWHLLPAFYGSVGRYFPIAALILGPEDPLAVPLNLGVLFTATGYAAYYLQEGLWKFSGWEGHVRRQREKERMQRTGVQVGLGQGVPREAQQAPGQADQQVSHQVPLSIAGVTVYPRKVPDPSALDRVIGLEEAKKRVMRAMSAALDTTGVYAQYGLSPPGGILLYGPPGTGKTSFARACADAFGCAFYVVNASAIVGSLVGQSEKAVSSLFQHARANRPAVIFWDEIDAVARRRDGASLNRPSDLVLNVLLAEMDGFQSKGEKGVLVIGATNRVDVLDPAILRPGRFDEKIEVGLPDVGTRAVMLEFFLKGRRAAGISREVLEEIAAATEGWSPAELKALVDEAAWTAVEAGTPITPAFLRRTLEKAARNRPADCL